MNGCVVSLAPQEVEPWLFGELIWFGWEAGGKGIVRQVSMSTFDFYIADSLVEGLI